jgi:hypothetical protein
MQPLIVQLKKPLLYSMLAGAQNKKTSRPPEVLQQRWMEQQRGAVISNRPYLLPRSAQNTRPVHAGSFCDHPEHLPFANHLHHLDSRDDRAGSPHHSRPLHSVQSPFDLPVIAFDSIVWAACSVATTTPDLAFIQ